MMKSVSALLGLLPLLALVNAQMMTGGAREYKPNDNDEEVLDVMKAINDFYAGSETNPVQRSLVKILKATSQVVSGALYEFKVEISGSENGNEICEVSLWSQPWMVPKNKIQMLKCAKKTDASRDDVEAQHALEQRVNNQLFNIFYMRAKDLDFERETVDGEVRFQLSNIKMAATACTKGQVMGYKASAEVFENCPVPVNAEATISCTATVVKRSDGTFDVESKDCKNIY